MNRTSTMPIGRRTLILLAALTLSSRVVAGQATGAIAGIVTDTAGKPLADISVVTYPADREVRTNSSGRFLVAALRSGAYNVRARGLAYQATDKVVTVKAGDTTNVTMVVQPRPIELDTVVTRGACKKISFEDFLCRQHRGQGVFLDEAAIDSVHGTWIGDVFKDQFGFRVVASGPRPPHTRPSPTTGWRCLTTLVDGRPVTDMNPVPWYTTELIGVEVYANPKDVPAELQRFRLGAQSRRCSLIVYWTTWPPRKIPKPVKPPEQ
jgi:hypothetical protein